MAQLPIQQKLPNLPSVPAEPNLPGIKTIPGVSVPAITTAEAISVTNQLNSNSAAITSIQSRIGSLSGALAKEKSNVTTLQASAGDSGQAQRLKSLSQTFSPSAVQASSKAAGLSQAKTLVSAVDRQHTIATKLQSEKQNLAALTAEQKSLQAQLNSVQAKVAAAQAKAKTRP